MNETDAWEQSACPTVGTVKVRVATALSLGRRLSQDSVWDTHSKGRVGLPLE